MSSLENSDTARKRKRVPLKDKTKVSADSMQKLDLLLDRNQYLEKEYARVALQLEKLKEEKEETAVKGSILQQLNELETRCASLQTKNTEIIQRMNEYHKQMQQAKSETIGIRRKLNGITGHVQAALARDSRPGSKDREPSSAYEALQQENKLLKWKLNVVDGYLSGMFSEEELK